MLGSVERDLARRALDTAAPAARPTPTSVSCAAGSRTCSVKNGHPENVNRPDTYGFSGAFAFTGATQY
jgi:hypothetical protein